MRPNYKPKFNNRPKHFQQNDSFYFFTIRTLDGQWFLKPDNYKQILLDIIKKKTAKFEFPIIAYAILNNHYHLMSKISDAGKISKFIGEINGASARAINQADSVTERKIWWNYCDRIILSEADFFKHLNYIHQNPIKHGLTKNFGYKFSSYQSWTKKKGEQYMNDCFEKYPIIDFTVSYDEL